MDLKHIILTMYCAKINVAKGMYRMCNSKILTVNTAYVYCVWVYVLDNNSDYP